MASARQTVEKQILSAFDGSANVKTVEQAIRPREAFGTNSEDPAAMHALRLAEGVAAAVLALADEFDSRGMRMHSQEQ